MQETQAILRHRGETLLVGLDVMFLFGTAFVQDAHAWSGTFYLPPDGFIAHGGPYDLVMADGRLGKVLVQQTRVEEGLILVEFVGFGPFPHGE
jgi:hypothetical protein